MAARKTSKKPPKKKPVRVKLPPNTSRENMTRAMAKALKAKYGADAAVATIDEMPMSTVREVVPTGLAALDRYVIGCGGIPAGRITEIAGEEGKGKTTLLLSVMGQAQREGGVAALIDAESDWHEGRAVVLGVNVEDVLVTQPTTLEEGLDHIFDILDLLDPRFGPNVIGYDSVAALCTEVELEMGADERPGILARLLQTKLKRVRKALMEKRCALIMLNQMREDIRAGGLKTPGGRYFKHAASIRIGLWGGARVADGFDKKIGHDVTAVGAKNRFVGDGRKARLRLLYGKGWDDPWSTVNHAKEEGLIGEKRRAGKPGSKTHQNALEELGWPAHVDLSAPSEAAAESPSGGES